MKTNTKTFGTSRTHEGAVSVSKSAVAELRRTVMANMLFEGQFYESGEDSAKRIQDLIKRVSFDDAAAIALEARENMKLRHVPLLIVRELLRNYSGRKVGDLVSQVIQRPDEMGELLALYWKDGKEQPLTAQLKVGLARAFKKFNEYQLAKWNKDAAVKIRDVMFLCHPRPSDKAQEALFKKVADDALETPDTWEVALSSGKDKKGTFERLMVERKLGALALLRNLRGMLECGVNEDIIREALSNMNAERVLPFRFISAARYVPQLEDALEATMFRCLEAQPKLSGKTAILVDNSGSMYGTKVSARSELDRSDAACAVAMLVREICEQSLVIGFSTSAVVIPNRRGFALAEAIKRGPGGGTDIQCAVDLADKNGYDRIIIITDEQSSQRISQPKAKGYIINVASYQNGIGYGPWVTIDGWSESVIDYIQQYESEGV